MDPRRFRELCMATGMDPRRLKELKGWMTAVGDKDYLHGEDDKEIYEDDGSVGGPIEMPDPEELRRSWRSEEPEKQEEDEGPSPRKETYEMTDEQLESEMSGIMLEGVRDNKGLERSQEVLAEMMIRAWRRGIKEGKAMSGV